MKCKEKHVMLYWSGELSRKHHAEMEQHLRTCNKCRKMLADLEALEQEFQTLPLLQPNRDLLRTALEEQRVPEKRLWVLPVPAAQFVAAAMLVVLGLVLFYVLMPKPERSSTSQLPARVPVASYFDGDLNHQMENLQEKVNTLKERMQGSPSRSIPVTQPAIHRTFSVVRSDLHELKADVLESGHFPFQDTFAKPGRKHYENDTFYYFRPDNPDVLSRFDAELC